MPIAYVLIGVPASGKSTWIESQDFNWGTTTVLSTDDKIESIAISNEQTYDEAWATDGVFRLANHLMNTDLKNALSNGNDIVWDQTNISVKSRRGKLQQLEGYRKIAVFFTTPSENEHNRRLQTRLGKTIPKHVVDSMKINLEFPTLAEGFNEIIVVDNE